MSPRSIILPKLKRSERCVRKLHTPMAQTTTLARPKVVLLGPAKVGKTRLVNSFFGDFRVRPYIPTPGVEVHQVTLSNGARLDVWDTAGDPNFGGLRDGYYSEASGFLILLNATCAHEFEYHLLDGRRVAPEARVVVAFDGEGGFSTQEPGVVVVRINLARRENLEAALLPFVAQ